ncbi:GNAT family N-acetyltransferase [Demequina muriae]|uniref:GNAT family N-acetyltransferase n=1 Tax=Demequina muriae TaxID=3051664 RepID=A0ABT8GI34_9MICO|nr:GNAT family N-acetyltransferase [Demequina sp. EGI L300058]MDN4481097.1 GNAT family N-acetyltransferase [Demequina sp. EGI L300058]
MGIRPALPGDEQAIARICVLTGDRGADASGMFGDDRAIADVYALPYLYGPGCFALVWDEGGSAVGYVVGTDDTRAFQDWFVADWWPSRPTREVQTEADRWLLPAALDPERMLTDLVDEYPAHLHIDLLPEAQGRGAGRALIEAAVEGLRERGVPGAHLVAAKANAGAQAFYPRVGFVPVSEDHSSVTFARRTSGG